MKTIVALPLLVLLAPLLAACGKTPGESDRSNRLVPGSVVHTVPYRVRPPWVERSDIRRTPGAVRPGVEREPPVRWM